MGYLFDIRLSESIYRSWSRQVADIGHLCYKERLKELGLFSIYGKLLQADITKPGEIFHGEVDVRLRGIFYGG